MSETQRAFSLRNDQPAGNILMERRRAVRASRYLATLVAFQGVVTEGTPKKTRGPHLAMSSGLRTQERITDAAEFYHGVIARVSEFSSAIVKLGLDAHQLGADEKALMYVDDARVLSLKSEVTPALKSIKEHCVLDQNTITAVNPGDTDILWSSTNLSALSQTLAQAMLECSYYPAALRDEVVLLNQNALLQSRRVHSRAVYKEAASHSVCYVFSRNRFAVSRRLTRVG